PSFRHVAAQGWHLCSPPLSARSACGTARWPGDSVRPLGDRKRDLPEAVARPSAEPVAYATLGPLRQHPLTLSPNPERVHAGLSQPPLFKTDGLRGYSTRRPTGSESPAVD